MEIQKIFSNIEDPEENLYSVLMDEEELVLFSELQREFTSKTFKELRKKFQDRQGADIVASQNGYETMKWGPGSNGQTEFEYFDKSGRKITGTGEFGGFGDRNRNIKAYRESQKASAQNMHGDVLAQRQKEIQEGATADLKRRMKSNLSDKSKKILEERRKPRQSAGNNHYNTSFNNSLKQNNSNIPKLPTSALNTSPSVTSSVAQNTIKGTKGGMLKKAAEFAKRNKAGLGIGAAGIAAAGATGAYLYNKNKKKDKEF